MRKQLLLPLLLLLASELSASENSYRRMAGEFSKAADRHRIKRIAVLPFIADGELSQEGRNVTQALTTQLARLGKVEVVEREMLDQLLQEQRLMYAGVTQSPQSPQDSHSLEAAEAILTGSVVRTQELLKVYARLIELKTGKLLAAADSQSEYDWTQGFDRSWGHQTAVPALEVAPPSLESFSPSALRDALADIRCSQLEETLSRFHVSILDLKARYWAAKMKEPDFSYSSLTHNPGSEIPNREIRMQFYDLLKSWYYQPQVPRLTPTETKALWDAERGMENLRQTCGEGGA
ncbi:MAG: hypothetical protein HY402_05520 [Elusimicrobia bacterium]|nr:hypothetical protein [Elusimicrobiota bacterium]